MGMEAVLGRLSNAMEIRAFGNTGLQVSALGLGAAEIGLQNVPDQTVNSLLGAALDAGLNVIDTAECYMDSEEKLGRALGTRRKQCFLFTKCGHAPRPRPAGLFVRAVRKFSRPITRAFRPALPDWNPRLLEQSIERSLRRLRTDWVDLIQLHGCSEETLRRGEAIEVLQRARQAGKARYVGYSGDGQAALYAVQCGQFDALETSLNIADQQALELTLPIARQRGMGVIAKRPIALAIWKISNRPEHPSYRVYWDRFQELGYEFLENEAHAVEVALRFTLSAPGVHTAIVGTTRLEHWRKNAEFVAAGPLDPKQMQAIRSRWKDVARTDWIGQE
jgi:aryl-alcohol dehydrogenase-like predicted oxidoreductase